MEGSNNILLEMIKQDMQLKGISKYHWNDEVVSNPSKIEVKENEVVYIYYFGNNQVDIWYKEQPFNIKLKSGTTLLEYSQKNCKVVSQDYFMDHSTFESNRVTRHLTTINFEIDNPKADFFIQYIKIKLLSNEEN